PTPLPPTPDPCRCRCAVVSLPVPGTIKSPLMRLSRLTALTCSLALPLPPPPAAQSYAQLSDDVRQMVAVPEAVVALPHVRVIDGTGAASRDDQNVIITDGRITAVGPAASTAVPANARVLDLSGHTVFPGIIGMHNHTFYTTSFGRSVQLNYSSPRLYLGSGVTTIRTTGSMSPYSELNLRKSINDGRIPGPRMHVTGPYISGEGAGGGMHQVATAEDARRVVGYWADEGATWFKFY